MAAVVVACSNDRLGENLYWASCKRFHFAYSTRLGKQRENWNETTIILWNDFEIYWITCKRLKGIHIYRFLFQIWFGVSIRVQNPRKMRSYTVWYRRHGGECLTKIKCKCCEKHNAFYHIKSISFDKRSLCQALVLWCCCCFSTPCTLFIYLFRFIFFVLLVRFKQFATP